MEKVNDMEHKKYKKGRGAIGKRREAIGD